MLPGGLVRDGERRRDLRFKRVSGRLELAIWECGEAASSLPHQVSLALAAALDRVGDAPADLDSVRELCVADRQFAMHRLAERLGLGQVWRTSTCAACGTPFDFPLDLGALPVKEPGAGYPFAEVAATPGRLRFRVPNGTDQEAIAALPPAEAVRTLVKRCQVEGPDVPAGAFTAEDLRAIEASLEEVSPGVVTQVEARCPSCGAGQRVSVEPYLSLKAGATLVSEVHALASAYHWSEREILSLPRKRRHKYLSLVDRARGLAS